MNKYAEITTTSGAGLFSIKDIVSCYLDAADDIVLDYGNGNQSKIASASALVQADVNIVFDVIKTAQQEKWSTVKYIIPSLSQSINAFTFTLNT
tara:strand:+ start:385 stop:666 length:282 start_codon:yes stop_codon:yes gene_type:complete